MNICQGSVSTWGTAMRSCIKNFCPLSKILSVLFTPLVFTVAGCDNGPNPSLSIIARSNIVNTNSFPPNTQFQVNASCQQNEQIIGGGYTITNTNSTDPHLAVEGNYPSAPNTWTVKARNPDNPPLSTNDVDESVIVIAYCLTNPNYPLDVEIASTTSSIPKQLGGGVPTNIEARCSKQNAIALSGGFETTSLPVFSEPGGGVHTEYWPGLLGTGISTSGPVFPDATHSSKGWHVMQIYAPGLNATAPQVNVSTTVYSICAQKNLINQSYRLVIAPASSSAIVASCDKSEFSVGGGYDKATIDSAGDGVPNVVFNAINIPGWKIAGPALGSKITGLALCIRYP